MRRIVVTGAGGFIGHHLVNRLWSDGHYVVGVDIKHPEFAPTKAHEFQLLDLRYMDNCLQATKWADEVYHLAADMGGIGYITEHHAEIASNNSYINLNMLNAAVKSKVNKFLFSSSACVYPAYLQESTIDIKGKRLKESAAIPADPEPGYGWEKLYMEQLCQYFRHVYPDALDTRTVRFHNVYGPLGTYDGGKEKSPAALCRKIAKVPYGGEIEIWGDGKQTRSYLYIKDCVEGLIRLMKSSCTSPLNLGTEELISIDHLAFKIAFLAGKEITLKHNLEMPQGVRGRNSDNTLLKQELGWEPTTPLEKGLKETYDWIARQVSQDKF